MKGQEGRVTLFSTYENIQDCNLRNCNAINQWSKIAVEKIEEMNACLDDILCFLYKSDDYKADECLRYRLKIYEGLKFFNDFLENENHLYLYGYQNRAGVNND